MIRLQLCWLLPLMLGACSYTDSGSGTGTLLVKATASYSVGPLAGNNFQLVVTVADINGARTGAQVVMTDGENGDRFTLAAVAGHDGSYAADVVGYRRRLELGVQSGSDSLKAKLEGPGPHVIDSPKPGGYHRSDLGDHLDVSWSTSDGIRADAVVIDLGHGIERTINDDTGSDDSIATQQLSTGDYDLTVTRSNRVDLAGGVGGSIFTTSYAVHSSFTLID
jgi:hypothetical protein